MFWIFSGLGLVGLLLIAAFPRLAVGTWLLNIGFVLVAMLASTIAHELGHAVAGAIAGYRMFGIDIGKGATVLDFKWSGLRWRFCSILFGGLARGYPKNLKFYRLKASLFILGGPAANLLLALVAWKLLWLDKILEPSPLAGFGPMGIVLLSNSLLLAFSLWPHQGNTAHGRLPNDALLIWLTWWRDRAKIAATGFYLYLCEADECRQDRKYAEARKCLEEGLREFPGHHFLQFSASHLACFRE